jgi:glutamate racemase
MFVPLVENGYTDSEVTRMIAKEYLVDLKQKNVDTLILGCTHYPLLKKVIGEIMGEGVTLIDSGAAAAEFAKEQLSKWDMLTDDPDEGKYQYYVSDSAQDFAKLGSMFLEKEICESVENIDIEKY